MAMRVMNGLCLINGSLNDTKSLNIVVVTLVSNVGYFIPTDLFGPFVTACLAYERVKPQAR